MTTAVVVGAGPNGLAAAVRLAQHGLDVEVLEAADHHRRRHPDQRADRARRAPRPLLGVPPDGRRLAVPAPARTWSATGCAGGGRRSTAPTRSTRGDAGLLWRSIDETAEGLGPDGAGWRRTFAAAAAGFDELADDLMRPIVHVPRHPIRLARFGPAALLPASVTARRWRTDKARALFGGVAAHAFYPLHRPTVVGDREDHHRRRPPSRLAGRRGRLAVDHRRPGRHCSTSSAARSTPASTVGTAADIPAADVVLLDLAPRRHRRHLRRPPPGPGRPRLPPVPPRSRARSRSTSPSKATCRGPTPTAAGPGPSTSAAPSRRSPPPNATSPRGACPSGRSSSSASSTWPTRPARPATSTRCGPTPTCRTATPATPPTPSSTRSNGSPPASGTASSPEPSGRPAQIAGLQPELRRRRHHHRRQHRPPARAAAHARPRPLPHRHPGTYICSAASPPGAGAHGMCGFHAAGSALRHLRIAYAGCALSAGNAHCHLSTRRARPMVRSRLSRHRGRGGCGASTKAAEVWCPTPSTTVGRRCVPSHHDHEPTPPSSMRTIHRCWAPTRWSA